MRGSYLHGICFVNKENSIQIKDYLLHPIVWVVPCLWTHITKFPFLNFPFKTWPSQASVLNVSVENCRPAHVHAPTYKTFLYVRDVHLISPTLIHAILFKTLLYVRGLHLSIPTLFYAIKIYATLNRGFWVAGSWSRTNAKKTRVFNFSQLVKETQRGRQTCWSACSSMRKR